MPPGYRIKGGQFATIGGLNMPDTLVFAAQIKKLEAFRHGQADSTALDEFDAETEQLILRTFREDTHLLEAYGLAIMGEAENIVNIPRRPRKTRRRTFLARRSSSAGRYWKPVWLSSLWSLTSRSLAPQ